ncbi:peritrophin-44-like [Eurosta solidaginis]|uniref:peritrophin-44-like n=1 Tax=Eurosta solidaginis TaxID=178769 RepID=UPI003530C66F
MSYSAVERKMKGLYNILIATILMTTLLEDIHCAEVLSADKDICRYFKNGAQLRKPGYCTIGIKCENSKSKDFLTCDSNMFYDRNMMKCVKSTTDSYCSSPCTTKTNGFVEDPKNCLGWYKCSGKTLLSSGYCESYLVFNRAAQMCDYPEKLTCKATYEVCDVAPNAMSFQYDDDDCATYRECVKSKTGATTLQTKSCESGKYFDRSTGACISKDLINCVKHPYPDKVCGTTKLALRNRFVGDGATCRGYFYCKDMGVGIPDPAPQWGQCPATTFFDPTEMACLSRNYVKCTENRCDGRENGYELSLKVGCRHYLVCKDNRTVEERYCGHDMWFDTTTEKCTANKKSYAACT